MQAFSCALIRGLVINGSAKVDIFLTVKLIKKGEDYNNPFEIEEE
jgi:hypothetical protein